MKALFQLSTNIIPEMEFERQFMAASGTTLDQARFAMAFIGALLAGTVIRIIPGAKGVSPPSTLDAPQVADSSQQRRHPQLPARLLQGTRLEPCRSHASPPSQQPNRCATAPVFVAVLSRDTPCRHHQHHTTPSSATPPA